jgi:hypothetical protein
MNDPPFEFIMLFSRLLDDSKDKVLSLISLFTSIDDGKSFLRCDKTGDKLEGSTEHLQSVELLPKDVTVQVASSTNSPEDSRRLQLGISYSYGHVMFI